MPAWKKNEAGRRGRDAYEGDEFYEPAGREPAQNRIERLTRTATALGHGYDTGPRRGPDEDLDAVADELDRLLSERGGAGQGRAQARTQRRPAQHRSAPPVSGMEDVLGALDRLDQQVEGLATSAVIAEEDNAQAHRAHPQSGRYAMDSLREGRRGDPYDQRLMGGHGMLDAEEAYRHDQEAARDRSSQVYPEASLHIYKDLGRRIDALRVPQEKALNQVREELGSLRDALGGISRGTSETVGRQNAELRRLADMVERLRADKRSDQFATEIRKEVAELKTMVGRTNVEGALQTLEHGYAHILQRLDELSRASVDPRVMRGVTARLNEIEDAFAALPRSEHMMVLEDRVVSIAERLEELLQLKGQDEIEPLRAELREVRGYVERIDVQGLVEGIDDRMKFVSSRLDDLEILAREQRGLDTRLSAMEQRMPEPETIARLQGRLEDIAGMMADDRASAGATDHLSQMDQRLDEIVDRLVRMEQTAPLPSAETGAFEALEKRLETISGKIDSIERKASRPAPVLDEAAIKAAAGPESTFLTQLQDRLNDLSDRLEAPTDTVTSADLERLRTEIGSMRESVHAPVSTAGLEQRISDLAQLVSQGGDAGDDDRFEELGAKVSELAAQLENNVPAAPDLNGVTSFLERIEQGLEQTRSDVSEVARKAAFDAVAHAPRPNFSQYDDAISSLQGDLKRLLDAAEGSEERTRNTFDSVKSVLGSLTERLDTLERADFKPPMSAPAEAAPVEAASFLAADPLPAYTPAKAQVETRQERSGQQLETGPGLSAQRSRDRKADFIAAARRAAQAASAEAAKLEDAHTPSAEGADEERGKARVGWLRSVLKRDKAEPAPEEAASGPESDLTQDELYLGQEHMAGSSFGAEEPAVLAGDRPAPEPAQAGGNRRRAILLAAVAVVLALGTLTAYKFVSGPPENGADLASAPQEVAPVVAQAPAVSEAQSKDVAAAAGKSADLEKSTETAPPEAAPEAAASGVKVPGSGKTLADTGKASAAPAAEPVQSAAANASATPEPDVAFAPPSGAAGHFGHKPAAQTGSFTPAKQTATAPAAAATAPAGAAPAPAPATAAPAASQDALAGLPPAGVGPMALRSAAAEGNPAAEFLVGVKYTEGKGVPADLSKAAVWYQKAANKGLPPAQYRLASLYEKGRGLDKDIAKAKAWYSLAAQAGNAKAMHNLAVLYAEGAGGDPDYAKAAMWFEAAANYGVKDSLFNLGILYAGGIGVEKDLVASYKWFAIAADKGDPEAAKRRDDVANMMDQEGLANARLAVESFTLKTPSPAANKVTLEEAWTGQTALPAKSASLTPADNSAMIREAQDKLNYLGFDTGSPDGQMGPRTRSAIRAFQRSIGLPETGDVDAKLLDELKSQAI